MVFEEDVLPDGTEVTYVANKQVQNCPMIVRCSPLSVRCTVTVVHFSCSYHLARCYLLAIKVDKAYVVSAAIKW